ncbi:MAG: DegT/DnrJ/EryC1/StrS family aminotransferase [Thermoguttaceae bacterium]
MSFTNNGQGSQNAAIQGVPLLDLGRQHSGLKAEVLAALGRVYDSGGFVLGAEVTQLEQQMAIYCQAKHAVGCASGSDALLLALMALEIAAGDEVILPSFTFFATASAVTRLGARPVFADIDPQTFNIDPQHVASLVTPNTKAIIPVHLFGQAADTAALAKIVEPRGIALVEDVAQAIGAEIEGRRAGSIGAIGCFSFYPTKNLGGAGDGGMLTTQSDELADRLRLLRGHGMRPRYYHSSIGINSRLDSFQAAVLNVKFPLLDHWTFLRQANADRYTELFTEAGLHRTLVLPKAMPGMRHVWNQYVIRVPEGQRTPLREALTAAHVGTEIYYPLGLHQQQCFAYLGYQPDDLPQTRRAAEEVLALPIFPELRAEEQKFVVEQIAAFLANGHHEPVVGGGHAVQPPKFLTRRSKAGAEKA